MNKTATLEQAVLELEMRRCAPDWETSTNQEKLDAFVYFCRKYAFIRHPARGKIPFELREAQIETVEAWLSNRYSIVLKARQIGFSTIASIFAFWLTYFYGDRTIIMLSRTEREAAGLLRHAKYVYKFLPDWMRALGPMLQITQTSFTMSNNSSLESMPSANDPARGSTAFLIIVDEIAFLPNSEDAWASIEPVAQIGGRVIMLSTANGVGNLFHKLWQGSQNATNRFKGLFFPWHAAGHDQAWFDKQCEDLPEWQRAQEYPDNPEEAFLKSGRPVFDTDAVRRLPTEDPLFVGRLDWKDGVDGSTVEFTEDGGSLNVWEKPKEGGVYVVGADVAMGLEHGDFSSAHVVEARSGKVVAAWWGHADPDLFGSYVLNLLGRWYGNALIGPENNNHGLTTVTALIREKYPNLYRQRKQGVKRPTKTETIGWNTNRATKPLMVDELNKMIRDGSLDLRCAHTVGELISYQREGDGKMHGQPHDDRVMSLGIAVQMLKFVWLSEFRPKKQKPVQGTWGHLMAKLFVDPSDDYGSRPLGADAVSRAA